MGLAHNIWPVFLKNKRPLCTFDQQVQDLVLIITLKPPWSLCSLQIKVYSLADAPYHNDLQAVDPDDIYDEPPAGEDGMNLL